jgi:hypothetical protein
MRGEEISDKLLKNLPPKTENSIIVAPTVYWQLFKIFFGMKDEYVVEPARRVVRGRGMSARSRAWHKISGGGAAGAGGKTN